MKKIFIPVLTLSLIVGGLYAGSQILAASQNQNQMMEALAAKLGKSTDEVQSAFNSVRDERQAQMQTEYEASLDEAVKNGELTEEKKQLILQKHAEIQALRQAEMEQRQKERAELENLGRIKGN